MILTRELGPCPTCGVMVGLGRRREIVHLPPLCADAAHRGVSFEAWLLDPDRSPPLTLEDVHEMQQARERERTAVTGAGRSAGPVEVWGPGRHPSTPAELPLRSPPRR